MEEKVITEDEKKAGSTKRTYNKRKSESEKTIENAIMTFNMNEDVTALSLETFVSKKNAAEGEEPGKYLKLKYKVMWCKRMFPYSYYDYEIVDNTDNSTLVTVTLYEDSMQNRILGKGTASICSMDLPLSVEPDIMKHKRILYAIGSAASRAYTNAGFGLQFDDDIFDAFEEMKKENESIGTGISAEDAIPNDEYKTSVDSEELLNTDVQETTDFIQETENISEEETVSNDITTFEEELPFPMSKMSIDDARNVVITVGKMGEAKVTIGYIADNCPANLVFLYKHNDTTPDEIEAIKVLVEAQPDISKVFAEKDVII